MDGLVKDFWVKGEEWEIGDRGLDMERSRIEQEQTERANWRDFLADHWRRRS